ncbi:hypothetical protein C5167_046609 [Papaver somniferum]|uniref:Dirigent protein n=2 Tax=Papaver somniferum TaxID=3469 RepID=A0A4Y7LF19_PAPSO|nr:hypothetical protein C5167_046609 [Papaver somniferum]
MPSMARKLLDGEKKYQSLPQHHVHVTRHQQHPNPIVFFMKDVLYNPNNHSPKSQPSSPSSMTTQITNHQIHPHHYPITGHHNPPKETKPLPKSISDPTHHLNSVPPGQYQTFNPSISNIGFTFPAMATLQGLESGNITPIDEQLILGSLDPLVIHTSSVFGKAKGVYVKRSNSLPVNDHAKGDHMMAMTVILANNGERPKDSLRFFGVHRITDPESHIAVIGGTGKFQGANGYASVKNITVNLKNLLLVTVYLS